MLMLAIAILAWTNPARALDDSENDTPTAWWITTGQTYDQVVNTLNTQNARLIDLRIDSTLSTYTATFVSNTGTYAKQWWFSVGADATTLANTLTSTGARLTSLQAYDSGGGEIRFNATMIANTGADAKAWWYYYNQPKSAIATLTSSNNARLTTLESYTSNGETLYAFIMISNTNGDYRALWGWNADATTQTITRMLEVNKVRLIDLTSAGNGNFNYVTEGCTNGCPVSWWFYGIGVNQVLTESGDYGARVFAADPYPGCGSNCLAALMISNTPADITACDQNGCISEAKLEANICGALQNKVVGYVCLVGGMRPGFGGLARTSTDAPRTLMTPDLVTDVASVSKTMTATAIMQLLAMNGISPDASIAPYLYPDWHPGPNINQITFRDLLTHRSGLEQQYGSFCDGAMDYESVEVLVVAGLVSNANIGTSPGAYGNCNFSLLRELMPALTGLSPLVMLEPNGLLRAAVSSSVYTSYLDDHVFSPVGVTDSSCTPPTTPTGILSYPYPAGTTQGTDWGSYQLQCGAAGWVLSAFDIFKVVNDLATGNTILTNSEKQTMFQGCLGWDCSVRPDCEFVCKNGAFPGGPQSDPWSTSDPQVWTFAGIVKCNVPVVVVVNSPLPAAYEPPAPGHNDIIGLVENALTSSVVPGVATSCP